MTMELEEQSIKSNDNTNTTLLDDIKTNYEKTENVLPKGQITVIVIVIYLIG